MTVSPLDHPRDVGSFEDFYREFYPRALTFLADRFPACDAEDLAQEAMTRCYRAFAHLEPDRDPWPWVRQVARSVGVESANRGAGRSGR